MYAARGWPVFPCMPGSKRPATLHGFKDATCEGDLIRKWWLGVPDANIGMPTGLVSVDVLDVDVRESGDGWRALDRLKLAGLLAGASAIVQTRSGGLHVYFRPLGQRCASLPREHLRPEG